MEAAGSEIIERLGRKEITAKQLCINVVDDNSLLGVMIAGISSSKASIRYGCAKAAMSLSGEHPELLYPYMDYFVGLLDSKKRILVWDSLAIIANLTRVDEAKKFDAIYEQYFRLLQNDYMVTVANVVGNAGKIASAKPYLVQKIASDILKVEDIKLTPHLTKECKMVIMQHAIKAFDGFFPDIENKEEVLSFVKRRLNCSRLTLRTEAQKFLRKWEKYD